MNRQQRRRQGKSDAIAVAAGSATEEKQVVQRGFQFHQQGNLQEALAHYQQVLTRNPSQPDALYLMGVLALQMRNYSLAQKLLLQALALMPNHNDTLMNLASVYQATGAFDEAEAMLDRALKLNAAVPELWFNYGNLHTAQGRHADAVTRFRQALTLRPDWADAAMQLGLAYKANGQLVEAKQAYRTALEIAPAHLHAAVNLNTVLTQLGEHAEAIARYRQLLENPAVSALAYVHNNLGITYADQGAWKQAVACCRAAVAREPENSEYISNLANALFADGHFADAETQYRQSVALAPQQAKMHYNLAFFLQDQGRKTDAEASYRCAIALQPDVAAPYVNLAGMLQGSGRLTEALQYLKTALQHFPNSSEAYLNLGNVYKDLGRHGDAMAAYKKAVALRPDFAVAHSNYLFAMHYDPQATPHDIQRETHAWAAQHIAHIPVHTHHANKRDPLKRLKIGYVSGDFRHHPVMTYLEPVLQSHDKTQVEIFCYANHHNTDAVTARVRDYADHWRPIAALSDDQASALIMADGIDILIDLSGHTALNRLLLFARKPAPVQATWIGYFNSTGVAAIDYYLTDAFLIPPEDEWMYTEKPLRLPSTAAPYQLRSYPVAVNPLPALERGYVTFGSFNALAKLTPDVVAVWAEILQQITTAKLYLKNNSFGDDLTATYYRTQFAAHGIAPNRLQFSGFSPIQEYLAEYNQIDIALDPFPYNAATTALDALWMGIPMVSLKGDRLVAHIGESMLGVVGLRDLVATDRAAYVQKAVRLATDLPRLAALRQNLRATLEASPMTNPALFTRGLEATLRTAWKTWCDG